TCRVHYQRSLRSVNCGEGVNHVEVPASVGRAQLIHGTASARAAVLVCAPQVAGGIQKDITDRAISVAGKQELVERSQGPALAGGTQLPGRAVLVQAAAERRPVKVAGGVGGHAAPGPAPVTLS